MPQDKSQLGIIVSGEDTYIEKGELDKYTTLTWKV
jgi:hypothetical protein